MRIQVKGISLLMCLLLCSCTEPGETTAVGAATGGVIGAGLGAIVGNQTGSAGAGLVLGGVAGATAGAAVGNAIEAQEESIRTQDEALERQENLLAAQKTEIRELRQLGQDSVSFRPDRSRYPSTRRAEGVRESYRGDQPAQSQATLDLQEKDLLASYKGSAGGNEAVSGAAAVVSQESTATETLEDSGRYVGEGTTECLQAEDEARSAFAASQSADKLLHLRRALRMCPGRASLHLRLAQVYRTLDRKADAEFEYKEALRLDPGNQAARTGLAGMNSATPGLE